MYEVLLFTFLPSFVIDYPALKKFVVLLSNHPEKVDVDCQFTASASVGNKNVAEK